MFVFWLGGWHETWMIVNKDTDQWLSLFVVLVFSKNIFTSVNALKALFLVAWQDCCCL